MENIPYRLSLWKDASVKLKVLVTKQDMENAISGTTLIYTSDDLENAKVFFKYDSETDRVYWGEADSAERSEIKIEKNFFDEVEIAELASDTSSYEGKAINITLNRNINGMNTLSFSLPKYFYVGKKKEENTLLTLIVPQSKIKLKYKDKWYSFIVTNKDESRDGKIIYFDYTCTDANIYELSKTGYELYFDEESEGEHSGQGTIDELALKILYSGEPTLNSEGFYDSDTGERRTDWYYRPISEEEFIETETVYERETVKTEEGITEEKYVIDPLTGKIKTHEDPVPTAISKIDKNLNKVVYRYKYTTVENPGKDDWVDSEEGRPLWGYSDILAYTPQAAKNMLSNGEDFTDTTNWKSLTSNTGSSTVDNVSITTQVDGILADFNDEVTENPLTYNLVLAPTGTGEAWVYNDSLKTSKQVLEANTVYAIRIKLNEEDSNSSTATFDIRFQEKSYSLNSEIAFSYSELKSDEYLVFMPLTDINNPYFMLKPSTTVRITQVQVYKVISKNLTEIPIKDVAKNLGLDANNPNIKSKSDFGDNYIFPDDEDVITNAPVEETIKLFYYETDESTVPTYFSPPIGATVEKLKAEGQKVRTLIEEKSNYYNLLQSLSELFEGWIRFDIEYLENGKIKRDAYGNQRKFIQFKEVVGQNRWAGFHYGVNVSSIQRTINSDEISTKIWVENSESTGSNTGLISIADSELNEIGETFVYNFYYYIETGMIPDTQFINDMYGTSSADLSFSYNMNRTKGELTHAQNTYTALNNTVRSLKDSRVGTILQIQSNIENAHIHAEYIPVNWSYNGVTVKDGKIFQGKYYTLKTTGKTYESLKEDSTSIGLGLPSDDNLYTHYQSARTFAGAIDNLYQSLEKINKQLGYYDDQDGQGWLCDIDFDVDDTINEDDYIYRPTGEDPIKPGYLLQQEEALEVVNKILAERQTYIQQFENKYRRFISEGTWSDDSYTDNDKYYLDAKRVATTSAYPQISYNIAVLSLSAQEGYEIFDVDVGDKTFICDTEFFGYDNFDDGTRTPHREEFVISEINDVLDNQTESTITVQNFRTQFEDLFSRISATVQTVQLNEQIYSRGENFTANGEILVSVLQKTLLNNSLTLSQSVNQNVIINDRGIEVIALNNTAKRLRIVADGIYVTRDGGLHWTAGFQADGMNAAFITTGQIDTSKVTISNNGIPSQIWDALGITAYQTVSDDDEGIALPLSLSGFVRFDQHGFYLLSTPVQTKTYIQDISELNTETDYSYIVNKEIQTVKYTQSSASTDGVIIYEFRNTLTDETYSLSEEEVKSNIYTAQVSGASAADFGYDSKGTPWFSSEEIIGKTPTWKNRLDYINSKAVVSLTWRGLNINSSTGSVEIGTDLPTVRVYDNTGGQFKGTNIARVDLGFSEEGIGAPTRADFTSSNPERIEQLYGLTLRNEKKQTVLQTLKSGSLWLAESLFIGDINTEDKISGTADTSFIGIQAIKDRDVEFTYQENEASESTTEIINCRQYQGNGETSDFIFWSRNPSNNETNDGQTDAFAYNFTIDINGGLTASSLKINGDSFFDGSIAAQDGNVYGVLGIGEYSTNINGETIYNSGFASKKQFASVEADLLIENNLYYYLKDGDSNNNYLPVSYYGQVGGFFAFEELFLPEGIGRFINLYPQQVSNQIFSLTNVNGDNTYAIWAGRLDDNFQELADGPIFSVTHEGELTSQKANIKGNITAVSGAIDGILTVGQSNLIMIDGENSSIYTSEKTFELLGNGTINAGDLNLTDRASIKGYVVIGDSFVLAKPPEFNKESNTAYDNGGVILSGEYEGNVFENYLKERTANNDELLKQASNFVLTKKGEVIAKKINITSSGSKITGDIVIENENDKSNTITISSDYGIFQTNSSGYNAWEIQKNGKAIFEDVTVRGTIQSSVMKYNEIQYSSGAILVRPASKVHKIEKISVTTMEEPLTEETTLIETWVWLEDKDIFNYSVPGIEGTIEVPDFFKKGSYCILQESFSSYNEVIILDNPSTDIEINNSGEETRFLKLKVQLPENFVNKYSENPEDCSVLSFIALGGDGEGGIFLNSMKEETKFGGGLALTIFENSLVESNDSEETTYSLTQNRKVVLGDLSSVTSNVFNNILENSLSGKLTGYGLYSENAFLKGTITTGNAGLTTTLDNGIVLWGGSTGNLRNIEFYQEGLDNKNDIIDYWRLNLADKYLALPNFFVSEDGFLFAKEGYFAGTIQSDNAEISGTIGLGGLKIANESKGLYVSYEQEEEGQLEEIVTASFTRQGLHLYSNADLEIYKDKFTPNSLPPTNSTPYIFSDDTMEGLIAQKILISELPDSQVTDYGILFKQQDFSFVKRVITSLEETRSERASMLGGIRDGLEDKFSNIKLAQFLINDNDREADSNIQPISLSLTIAQTENPVLKFFSNYLEIEEARVNNTIKTPEVRFDYYNIDAGLETSNTVTVKAVKNGVDIYVLGEKEEEINEENS